MEGEKASLATQPPPSPLRSRLRVRESQVLDQREKVMSGDPGETAQLWEGVTVTQRPPPTLPSSLRWQWLDQQAALVVQGLPQ